MNKIKFLNIDLDIESKKDASLIAKEFGKRVTTMRSEFYEGLYCASFETGYLEENEIIEEYISLINSLSSDAKSLWNNCTKRVFDFGYSGGREPNNFHSTISENSINLLASVGGSVVVTIYPSNKENT